MNIQDWFPLRWTGWISSQSMGISNSFLQHHISKASVLCHSAFFMVQLLYLHMTIGKTIALTVRTFVGKLMSLLFNMLSRFVSFFSKKHHLLISWLQSLSAMILELKKIKSFTASTFSPFYLPWSDETRCHNLSFCMLTFKPAFSLSSFTIIKRLFNFSSLSAIYLTLFGYF